MNEGLGREPGKTGAKFFFLSDPLEELRGVMQFSIGSVSALAALQGSKKSLQSDRFIEVQKTCLESYSRMPKIAGASVCNVRRILQVSTVHLL